jgi:polyphosphate kinase
MSEQQYTNRDLSWLAFNYRVLQEAKDASLPLMERIKFLAIFSSNLDEFFRVRVANHQNVVRVGKKAKKELGYEPKDLLREIKQIVNKHLTEFSRIFEQQIVPELGKNNINMLRRNDLNEEQKVFLEDFFQNYLLPYVQPVLLVKDKIRPFLVNGEIYLAIRLQQKNRVAIEEYAILKIPSDHLSRFIILPSAKENQHDIIMLDDLVRQSAAWFFPGYNIIDAYSIKLTRDAELYIDDEFSGDLIQKIKTSLNKRNVGPASRFVFDRTMPDKMVDFLTDMFQIDKKETLPEGRYHNNADFFKFPDFDMQHLKNPPLPPLPYDDLEKTPDFFQQVTVQDHLLYYPYHSYKSVVRFFKEAANDPNVTHIKVVQYRVARKSKIMNALIDAAQAGKQVFVFIEAKARFDEEANLSWGEQLIQAGVQVRYSMPGIKVHAKIAQIHRIEDGRTKLYTYLSSGNFHEDTSKIYSDFGLFTSEKAMCEDVSRIFQYLETLEKTKKKFKHLLVGQFNLREQLEAAIDREIANAKEGKKASIFLKMNSLEDEEMIDRLYKASNAGVQIRIVVRGICCLVPGVKKMSENIKIISIVDRFLEHARVFIFHNDGVQDTYISSADWMTRNLSHRVETAFPIFDEKLKSQIHGFMEIQWNDNVKARKVEATLSNKYNSKNKAIAIRSQFETYYMVKKMSE